MGLVTTTLFAATLVSVAQTAGAELTEPVPAELAGPDAFVTVTDVSAFPPSGDALFEAGTPNEERFTYSAVDSDLNRLVGLSRSSPGAHAAGAPVAPLEAADQGEPEPATTEAEPSSGTPPQTTSTEGDGDDGAAGDMACADPTPDDCAESGGSTTRDLPECDVQSVLCEIVDEVQQCESNELLCQIVEEVLDNVDTGDPCDPDNTGQTCTEYVGELLNCGTDDCGPLIEDCEISNLPVVGAVVRNLCDAVNDPLGPWSVCDLDNSGATCPDPEDVIDLLWEVESPLSSLECSASVSGPSISEGGGMVKGKGTFSCDEIYVGYIEIRVCLYRATAGGWLKMGCRFNKDEAPAYATISQRIAEPCVKQQTVAYKIRARGEAIDGLDAENHDTDVAKATATLYCPGTAVDMAVQDALEYAESWLPTND